MIKSIFVGLNLGNESLDVLGSIGANHLIVAGENINKNKWKDLQKLGMKLAISVVSFRRGKCPLSPESKERLFRVVNEAMKWNPKEIWFDHFRFDGKWEEVNTDESRKSYVYKSSHKPCKWCKDKNRTQNIYKLALWARSLIPERINIGYFAVPFKLDPETKLVWELGQDHRLLGKVFDISSPMLYHRMIRKPTVYISDYVAYLHKITKKPVLPIIQIKDMPDELPDELKHFEFVEAYEQALKSPSIGVSIFMWEHAVEKGKIDWVRKVFTQS